MPNKKKIKRIVVHHSASYWGTALDIDKWHKKRGWREIGYSFVIQNGVPTYDDYKNNRKFYELVGEIECGRKLNADPWLDAKEKGAHAYGYNSDSIGICLIHKDEKYDERMLSKLFQLVTELIDKFDIDIEKIQGHYELDKNKPDCPSIDMKEFRSYLYQYYLWKRKTTKS